MLYKIKLIIYYLVIAKLPHSRLSSMLNKLRVWYCARILKILFYDQNSKFEYSIYISDGKKIKIGKCCRINENVFLQGSIEIGDYALIAPNVAIYSSTHIYDDILEPMVLRGLTVNKTVCIEDDVWIGRNSIILPGLRIRNGCIIGANSVVTKDTVPYGVYGGVPAKLIRIRK